MGLFDIFKKKDCEICGKEVGLFGYKKLEDGEICKDCVSLLSPWFDDRRHSTVEQIKAQLAYREENKKELASFRPTISLGRYYEIKVELEGGVPKRFVIARDNYMEENADIISFSKVRSFDIDIREHRDEQEYRNKDGEMVKYNPPRYEYSYDFYCDLMVDAPYFDDISVRINSDTVCLETVMQNRGIGQIFMNNNFDPTLYPEYREYKAICDQLTDIFNAGMSGTALPGYAQAAPAPQPAPANTPDLPDLAQELLAKIPNAKMEELDDLCKKASDITILNRPDYKEIQDKIFKAVSDRAMELHAMRVGNQTAAAAEPAKPKFCPACGAAAGDGKFCEFCGTKF